MGKENAILLVIFSGVIGIALGFAIPAIMAEKPPQGMVVVEKEKSYFSYTNFTLLVTKSENVCEECHLSGKKVIPQADRIIEHTEGGRYCLKCHKISHETHPLNENVTCTGCHGDTAPKIPSQADGGRFCNNCHAYPDPLAPSYGNLIAIHEPRGTGCVSCHINCSTCHEQGLTGDKWNERMKHFDTLLRVYK